LKEILDRRNANVTLRVLDIGCGGGTLLYILGEELSLQKMTGVELNPVYADLAQSRLDADIRNENYKSGIFGEKFDLLINTKVLEHIPDPLPFLKEMWQDLVSGGLLFIEVPDVSDMYNFPLDDERFSIPHIYFFSENTLSALLEKAGFNVIETRVVSASRNRSYLQIVAEKSIIQAGSFLQEPFDDVKVVCDKIKENMDEQSRKVTSDGD
jgi:SAM-dependent methyltransferase